MGKKLRTVLLAVVAVQTVAWVVAQVFSRRLSRGDEHTDEFQVAAICGGRRFQSRAEHLRRGSVVASMGGVDLDLRDATLDAAGATLDVTATMGGVHVVVPETWAVDVDKSGRAGGVEARVTPRTSLPADAPRLHVNAVVRMGGTMVTTDPLPRP